MRARNPYQTFPRWNEPAEYHHTYEGIAKWKVNHPNAPNNIVQMQSGGFQAPFYMGGSQVPYTLGIRGNSDTSEMPTNQPYSATERFFKRKV
jgi:hypothetical protein